MHTRDTLLRIVLISLLAYSLLSFLKVSRDVSEAENFRQHLEQKLKEEQSEEARLEAALSTGCSPEEMERLARERLGMVFPGEKIFYFSTDREG